MSRFSVFSLCLVALIAARTAAASATTITATWYNLPGSPMANGELFDPRNPTLAAGTKTLYGKVLLVTNPKNGKSIIVFVKDKMHKKWQFRIDLSPAGAAQLGFLTDGRVLVDIQELLP